MKSKVTIGGIDCYGKLVWDSNVLIVGTYANGEEFEEVYADGVDDEDDETGEKAISWSALIARLEPWAHRIGLTILEMSPC